MRRALRYFQIAATSFSLSACVLLVALWVRSYTWRDTFCLRIDGVHDQWCQSLNGKLMYDAGTSLAQNRLFRWIVHPAEPLREPEYWVTTPVLGFQWSRGADPQPMIPHWFPTVIFAALAVLPWLQWRRFSLRALLIVMTVAAILMGAVAYFISMAPEPQYQTTTVAPASEFETDDEDPYGDLFEEEPFPPF
jgi:hypothetical protein